MGLDLIPKSLRAKYTFEERDHACAILQTDFRSEFKDILDGLRAFTLKKSEILTPGGGRSPISIAIDSFLRRRGWAPKTFDIQIEVDGSPITIPTHGIDNFKNRVAVEVEWSGVERQDDHELTVRR